MHVRCRAASRSTTMWHSSLAGHSLMDYYIECGYFLLNASECEATHDVNMAEKAPSGSSNKKLFHELPDGSIASDSYIIIVISDRF